MSTGTYEDAVWRHTSRDGVGRLTTPLKQEAFVSQSGYLLLEGGGGKSGFTPRKEDGTISFSHAEGGGEGVETKRF